MNLKILYFFYLVGILFICSCKSNKEIIPYDRWQAKQVVVDGNASEWQLPLKYYVHEGKLGCTLSNDNVNLYVCVRSTDQVIQMKMMKAGMTVGIDTAGKHNPQFHISYPLDKAKPEGSKDIVKEIKTEQDPSTHHGRKKKLMAEQSTMIVTGFAGTESGETVLKTVSGLNVGLDIDSINILTYEAVIPLKTIYGEKFSSKDTSKIISVSIVVNGIKMETPATNGGGGGGMSGGGMGGGGGMSGGGMSGGGMGGGGRGGGGHRGGGGNSGGGSSASSNYPSLSEREKMEIKCRLSVR